MNDLSYLISWFDCVDKCLMLLVNSFHTPYFDSVMWGISDRWIWIPLYMLLAFYVLRKYGRRRGIICLVVIGLMITAVDQTCASVIRPVVGRLRPASPDNPISTLVHVVNGYRGGRYGFPSCHAANTFALAVFLSLLFRNRDFTLMIIFWSFLVSYSRVYLGVHYPGDIFVGYIIGGMCGLFFYLLVKHIGRPAVYRRVCPLPEMIRL